MPGGRVVVGVLLVGVFCAILLAYACTEFLLVHLDLRRRVMEGKSGLPMLLAVNVASLAVVWSIGASLVAASGQNLHLQAALIAVGAQMVWLIQLLWFYHRDHLRVRYEN
jgi:cellobiose-specific phosphotransferase system component IIC